jgi:NMT1-like family
MNNEPTPPSDSTGENQPKTGKPRLLGSLMEVFGLSRGAALSTLIVVAFALLVASFYFFYSAPKKTIIITAGPAGSTFQTFAERYRTNLSSNGITLKILSSQGSRENLERLQAKSFDVDIGFVQGGVTNATGSDGLTSLGSVVYEPLFIFYRGNSNITLLSDLAGKRLAIGIPGSGTRDLALTLLQLNGIEPGGPTKLADLDGEEAANALLTNKVDVIFVMGDSASSDLIRRLLRNGDIHLFDFAQADGYTRRITYLSKLVLPQGSIDFGRNMPAHDVNLIGPTLEILARPEFHAALSDLLLEAAQQVHGQAGLLKHRAEFPAPLEHDFPISADAARFYKSGKAFLYRSLPFWLASIVRRILFAIVPAIVVLIPAVRLIPAAFQWRIKMRLYRWYRALIALERNGVATPTPEVLRNSLARLDEIEAAVNRFKVPASFAGQFYGLREHIDFVRSRLSPPTES